MSFPAYSSYKDSGVEWLGEVPSHWSVVRFKTVVRERDDRSDKGDEELLSVSAYTGVSPRSQIVDDGDHLSRAESLVGYKRCFPDDLVMNIMLAWNRGLGVSRYAGIVSPAYCVFALRSSIVPKFLDYLIRSDEYTKYFKSFSSGVIDSRLRLYPNTFGALYCGLPPSAEQTAIAAFLDRETAKIDALVEEQRRLIALLKEKRRAVISHIVTKGRNPDAPMKHSGIDWLGEVPAHWRISPLMRLTAPGRDIMYGIVLPGPDVGEGGVPIVKGGDVKPHRLKLELLNRTTQEIEFPFARARLKPLDVVYSIRGSIGDAEEVPNELDGANITQDAARISPSQDVNPRWLLYVMRSKRVFAQLEQRSLGATVRGINIYDLKRAIVPVPSEAEQKEISAFLDVECSRLDDLSATASRGIELLQERRAALISAAVTGKIEVVGTASVLSFHVDRARARGLIATEIIECSAHQATFGRVKLQKIAYLAETHAGVTELEGAYLREAAGPLDWDMIGEMESEAGILADIQVEQPDGAGSAVAYKLGDRRRAHFQDLAALLGERAAKFDKLIRDIGTIDMKGAEAVATLYAVWNDALIEGETPSDMEIKLAVLSEWHPEKAKKFHIHELQTWLGWMRRHDLVPTGTGPKTSTTWLFA